MTRIGARLIDDLYACFPPSQAAYQPGRETVEQIFVIPGYRKINWFQLSCMYVAFNDFTKAFDSIKLGKLWEISNKSSINIRYINLLKTVYDVLEPLSKLTLV